MVPCCCVLQRRGTPVFTWQKAEGQESSPSTLSHFTRVFIPFMGMVLSCLYSLPKATHFNIVVLRIHLQSEHWKKHHQTNHRAQNNWRNNYQNFFSYGNVSSFNYKKFNENWHLSDIFMFHLAAMKIIHNLLFIKNYMYKYFERKINNNVVRWLEFHYCILSKVNKITWS